MRSGLITIIILLISAFVLLLGTRTDVKPQRHLRGYFAGVLLVSIPSAIWLIWQKSMGNIELNGPIFGLTLNVILVLVLLPFVGLYLWGLVKKFVGDKQLSILLPIFGIGVFGGFSLILLINGATGFAKFSAMSALIACVVILFSKLLFTARFWSFQVLLVVVWFIVSLVSSIFGHKLFGKMLNVNALLILISFMNVFLVVYDWFDNKKTYLAEDNLSLNNDNIEYSTKTAKAVTSEAIKSKKIVSKPRSNNAMGGNAVYGFGSSNISQPEIGTAGHSSTVIEAPRAYTSSPPKGDYNPKAVGVAIADENTSSRIDKPIELPEPVRQNISKPIAEPSVNTNLEYNKSSQKQRSANSRQVQNSLSNAKSQKSLLEAEPFGASNTWRKPVSIPAGADTSTSKLNEPKVIKNNPKQKSSKFRIPKVHFISRLLRFSMGSDIDQLTKENNDFKMPVFGTSLNYSRNNSKEDEPEFSVNIRTGETTIKNANSATALNKINKGSPKINSDLNMPRSNFAINTGLKSSISKQVFKRKNTNTKIGKNKVVENAHPATIKKGIFKTSQITKTPITASRVTESLQSISNRQPRQKRLSKAENFRSSSTTPLNIDALSKIVGRYNNSSVGRYINKATLAIPYTSQETLGKIVAYKNSLLKRMTARNTKRFTYVGKGQDNLLIDRLHRTTRPLSTNKLSI